MTREPVELLRTEHSNSDVCHLQGRAPVVQATCDVPAANSLDDEPEAGALRQMINSSQPGSHPSRESIVHRQHPTSTVTEEALRSVEDIGHEVTDIKDLDLQWKRERARNTVRAAIERDRRASLDAAWESLLARFPD